MLECGRNLSNPCKSLSNYDVTAVVQDFKQFVEMS